MNQLDLNKIPEDIKAGKITKKDAVHKLAVFLTTNGAIFGLNQKDEDFRSEVTILLLERGENVIDLFNPDYGSFFTYFFCFVKSLMNTVNRQHLSSFAEDYHSISESISNFDQTQEAYNHISFNDFQTNKVPYAYKQVPPEALQLACKSKNYHIKEFLNDKTDSFSDLQNNLKKVSPSMAERILLVLALKSAYYISDSQIKKIAEICNVDENQFQDVIFNLKNDLSLRETNKMELEIRRNKAYFQHRKYKSQLEWNNQDKDENSKYHNLILEKKYKKHTLSWNKLNEQLEKGTINIRPTNKAIANALGMCERQISYYIRSAYSLGFDI